MKEEITADLVLEGSWVSRSFFQFMTIANYDAIMSLVCALVCMCMHFLRGCAQEWDFLANRIYVHIKLRDVKF